MINWRRPIRHAGLLAWGLCCGISVPVAMPAGAGEAEPSPAPMDAPVQPSDPGNEAAADQPPPVQPPPVQPPANRPSPEENAPDGKLTVEQILAETLDEDDYGNPTRCIDMKRIRTTKILDRQHVVFRSSNRRIWLVKLIPPCRSLDYDDVLSLPMTTGRLCRLDSIYTIDRASRIPGVPCKIDTFREISKEQYDFLREELKKHRNR